MFNKWFALLLVVIMVLGLVGCGKEPVQPETKVNDILAWLENAEMKKSDDSTTRVLGNICINLYESQEEIAEPTHDALVAAHENYLADIKLIPGITVGKHTYVENTGSMPAYVRFRVIVPADSDKCFHLNFNENDFDVVKNGNEYVATGKQPVEAGCIAGPGLKTLEMDPYMIGQDVATLLESGAMEHGAQITVVAEAIQSTGFNNATEAFAEFDKKK